MFSYLFYEYIDFWGSAAVLMGMKISPAQIRMIRYRLPKGVATKVRGKDAAAAAGITYQTWKSWESLGVSAAGPVAILRLLCIDQGLIGAEDDFGAWLDTLLDEEVAA